MLMYSIFIFLVLSLVVLLITTNLKNVKVEQSKYNEQPNIRGMVKSIVNKSNRFVRLVSTIIVVI